MKERKWTEEQTKFLIENYEKMKTNELMVVLTDKTNDQIRWKAKEFKLNKQVTKSKKDITWLENLDDPNSLYWWGFITADGCITDRQLIISISKKDQDHLSIFANKINSSISQIHRINEWNPKGSELVRVAVDDKRTITRIRHRFSIIDKKTYNPFDLSEFFTQNRLKYFICGLIDGDGYIDNINKNAVIKIHPNWINTLVELKNHLKLFYNISSTTSLNKEGWAILRISVSGCKHLKHIVSDSVPLMERKWNRI